MDHPKHRLGRLMPLLSSPMATGLGYYLAAVVSLMLSRGEEGIATLWPSSGILFAVLLIAPRRMVAWHVAGAAVASLAANLGSGSSLQTSIIFTIANVAESSLAAGLLRTRSNGPITLVEPAGLTPFCVAAFLGTTVGATIATGMTPIISPAFWFSWFSTDLLGILVVTPLILIIGRSLQRTNLRPEPGTVIEIIAVLGGVAVVSIGTFGQSSYPLLFLPMLSVLFAVFRLGPLGAAGGVLIVGIVSSASISVGSGPPTLIHSGILTRSLFLQFYLLALFAAALPIAALLAARNRLVKQLHEKMRLLHLAESAAHVGHWRLDTVSQQITWSREVFRIHGIEGEVPPSLANAIDSYHPDDRQRVAEHLEKSLEQGYGFEFTARIVRPDGELCHVFSRGEIDRNTPDGPFGLFGIIQDVTTQVAHETALEAARVRAEQAAQEATVMAETDPLTGIANRRRTTLSLEQAVMASRETDRPISVAMFDIDHFKRINDEFGHQAGDEVLKRVAADAARELRNGDTVGRFGGEEFVIVLPNANADTAIQVAERVRNVIEAGGTDPVVTISIGVAELANGEAGDSLLQRADRALYIAKNDGRNTLRLAA